MSKEILDRRIVCVKDLTGEEVFQYLGWPWDDDGVARCYLLAQQLSEMGLVRQQPRSGGYIGLVPTYMGIVRVTREVETKQTQLVRELLAEWETTNVDFKRELNLGKDKEKAEFIRDILGLANTKSSGRRYLVIGFENKTRRFYQSIDASITQERLEQILTAYTEPAPRIKLSRVPWPGGAVGLIETIRGQRGIPYKVKKSLGGQGGIREGDVFVRHGSHTEPPTAQEYQNLMAEGDGARRAP